MKKTFLVMLYEIGTTLRRKSFTIMAFGVPLVLGVIALIVMLVNPDATADAGATEAITEPEQTTEGYVDPGGLIVTMPADIPPDWLIPYPDEATAQAALEAGEISAYYVISDDYVETGELVVVMEQYSPVSGDLSIGGMEWILYANLVGDEALAAQVWRPLDVHVTYLTPESAVDQGNWAIELFPVLMVIILYMVILIPAGVLISAVTDEKKNYVIEVLLSSMSPLQMITGKILALGLLGLVQMGLWVGVLWLVMTFGGRPLNIPEGFELPTQMWVWTFVFGLLGYAMYGAQMAGVGALAPDIRDVRGVSFIIMLPLVFVYMFATVIYNDPNGLFAMIMSLFPLTAPVGMIARMTQVTVPVWQLALTTALQFLTAILIVRLSARLFYAQHLLSGQIFSAKRYFAVLLGREG